MKRLILAASLILTSAIAANAQSTQTVEQQTQQQVAQLGQLLNLTPTQEEQLYNANLNFNKRLVVINDPVNAAHKAQALAELNNKRITTYKGILTAAQMDAYMQANPQ